MKWKINVRVIQRLLRVMTGLETWFNLPHYNGAIIPPPRYKMALISWLAIYPLVLVILELLNPILIILPIPLRAAIITLISITSMTYFLMPHIVRLFSAWLYPKTDKCNTTNDQHSEE